MKLFPDRFGTKNEYKHNRKNIHFIPLKKIYIYDHDNFCNYTCIKKIHFYITYK